MGKYGTVLGCFCQTLICEFFIYFSSVPVYKGNNENKAISKFTKVNMGNPVTQWTFMSWQRFEQQQLKEVAQHSVTHTYKKLVLLLAKSNKTFRSGLINFDN